jgi:hypothetical protein
VIQFDVESGAAHRLDVAVNNAGTEGQVGPITDQTGSTSSKSASKTERRPRAGHIYWSKNMTAKSEESNKALVPIDRE